MRLILQDGYWVVHIKLIRYLNFLHNSLWITFPIQSCNVLYSFCTNFLLSHIKWLTVSSLLPDNLHLLFCCVLSIFALTYFVLMALFRATIRRNFVSLLRFPFLSQCQILCEIPRVCRLKYQYSCCTSHFCFLVIVVLLMFVLFVLFVMAVLNLSLLFLCCLRVVSMNRRCLLC